ncbi:uncharacterized protein YbjQ (UPF0145 family) [Bradyrhizobium diazoefficiens]
MFTPPAAWFTGFIPDLPTPLDAADTIDLKAFTALCERQIAAGVPAIVVCETAGEAPTLSPAEQELVIRAAVDVARGRVRIIAGAMSNATSQAIALARRAEAAGADAVMAVVPAYNKPMQEGMLAHFRAIAGATGLPVILHDIPSRTLRPLADETLVRLVESRQFVGLRDGSCDIARPMRLARLLPAGFRPALRRRRHRVRLHRKRRRRRDLGSLQHRPRSVPHDLLAGQARPLAIGTVPAQAPHPAHHMPLQGRPGGAQERAERAGPDVTGDEAADRAAGRGRAAGGGTRLRRDRRRGVDRPRRRLTPRAVVRISHAAIS